MSLSERLSRLLFIVPYVAHRDGVPLNELADKLGVGAAQIEADLDLLSFVGQPPLTPDHLIDLYVEDQIVYVDLDQRLSRPPKLSHEEARALVIGAKLLGDQGGLGQALNDLLERIVALLSPKDQEMVRAATERVEVWHETVPPNAPVQGLRSAIERGQEVRVTYFSASSEQVKSYHLQPLALFAHSGIEYLLSNDVEAGLDGKGQEKLFRLDRLQSAVLVEGAFFEKPAAMDLSRFRTHNLYANHDGHEVWVRFSPKLAPRLRERFAAADVRAESTGHLCVRMSTSSAGFLARWVLPFGAEAEVLDAPHRHHLRNFCADALKAYGG